MPHMPHDPDHNNPGRMHASWTICCDSTCDTGLSQSLTKPGVVLTLIALALSQEKWDKNMYIASIAFGRTVS